MTDEQIKKKEIETALAQIPASDFLETTKDLLAVLGYRSQRTLNLSGNVDDFIHRLRAPTQDTETEREFRAEVESIKPVFQITSDEIENSGQIELFESPNFDEGRAKSFMFFAVQLKGKNYPRGKYAQFTREINKRIIMPVVVIFCVKSSCHPLGRVENRLTIGFVRRRPHKRKSKRNVLEQVTLIKDIALNNPHRAHLDILFELSLEECAKWMGSNNQPENFDGLLAAWLARLDTEALNKQFYRDLFNWFEWAVKEAKFPTKENSVLKPEEHVIRLITRLLFIWFIKEKGLVADELFNETQVSPLLKAYDPDTGDSYYRAVLQNLFFATLNTEIDAKEPRRFSKGGNDDHRNFSLYRYENQISAPDGLLELFAQTPFINGGLFDCLDSFKGTKKGGYRIDCFSDEHYKKLSIPNCLFFDKTHGLIPLLKRYKFTVEESTPIEQEVALDPELLGKVFENLLAEYNPKIDAESDSETNAESDPKTGETAQKQTGSYYTPRAIVDYMVEEALVATLAGQVSPTEDNAELWEEELHYLLDYAHECDDASEWFDDDEKDEIVRAISELKILDPAVGSGAFPMGVLHKLTLALRRLDPDNIRWEKLQQERAGQRATDAFTTKDDQARAEELREIDETFKRYRDSDFGRKLYLIQNSIFGVDIQPVACQIAKLRFFISLAIEQEPDETAANFGIKPLPNLETRFVAANTLIGLQPSEATLLLQADTVQQWLEKIEGIRDKYFLQNNRQEKLDLEKQEDEYRDQLKAELENQRTKWMERQKREIERKVAQLPNPEHREQLLEEEQKRYRVRKEKFDSDFEDARKIADWKPYDQNTSADFFDPEWMFGVRDGFDITIGNPPYVRADSGDKHLKMRQKIEESKQYETLWEKWDLYIPFIERSYKLLKPDGFTTLIVSDAYCHSKYAQKSQNWFLENSRIVRLDFFSKIKIFDAGVHNITYLFQRADGSPQKPERRVHAPEFGTVNLLPTNAQRELTHRVFFPEDTDLQQFSGLTVTLTEICYISTGLRPWLAGRLKNKQSNFITTDLVQETRDSKHPKKWVESKDLTRWFIRRVRYLEWGTVRAPAQFESKTFPELYEAPEKLLAKDTSVQGIEVAYDPNQCIPSHTAYCCVPWRNLSGVRNTSIKKQTRYSDEIPHPDLPQREELEQTSRRFSMKFLLGVMNSTVAHNFLKANRRSNIHLYPDDWKKLPIPDVSPEEQAPIIELVDQILTTKRTAPDADVSDLENEIDQIVYLLYGITPDENEIVEEKS